MRIAALFGLLMLSGCVRSYQPLAGLHHPVVVDTTAPNFRDVRLTVACLPGELLSRLETTQLCKRVGQLFEVQGALVTTKIGGVAQLGDGEAPEADSETLERADLTLELRSRRVHSSAHPISWVANVASFTLVPGLVEQTFAQDVVVRDGSGFLLATVTLQGRLVESFGVGPWVGNKLLDWVWREPEEDVARDGVVDAQLSDDLYKQLSQVVYNAKLQWQVQQRATALPGLR